jgi:hypothetical protein
MQKRDKESEQEILRFFSFEFLSSNENESLMSQRTRVLAQKIILKFNWFSFKPNVMMVYSVNILGNVAPIKEVKSNDHLTKFTLVQSDTLTGRQIMTVTVITINFHELGTKSFCCNRKKQLFFPFFSLTEINVREVHCCQFLTTFEKNNFCSDSLKHTHSLPLSSLSSLSPSLPLSPLPFSHSLAFLISLTRWSFCRQKKFSQRS